LYTLVRSSPLAADTDGDGMNDHTEYYLHHQSAVQYPYNTNVWNTPPLTQQLEAGTANFLRPGSTSILTDTVQKSGATPIKGDLTLTMPSGITTTDVNPVSFEVTSQGSYIKTFHLQVAAGLPASQMTISSSACAMLEMPLVYLSFDEPSGSLTFYNQATSGLYDATCGGNTAYCPTSVTGIFGNGVRFSNTKQYLTLNGSVNDLKFSGYQPFSLSVWVMPDPSSLYNDYFSIISNNDTKDKLHGYNLYLERQISYATNEYTYSFNNELESYTLTKDQK
jgi:hypothetical protein